MPSLTEQMQQIIRRVRGVMRFPCRKGGDQDMVFHWTLDTSQLASLLDHIRHQLLLDNDAFIERYKSGKNPEKLREVSKAHRLSTALSLDEYRPDIRVETKQWLVPDNKIIIPCRELAIILVFIT